VAWCPSDSNDGELVQVVFDDKSAPTLLTVGQFNQSRAAYIAVHPYDKTISEEAKERRENERRERGLGRGVGSRGGRNGRGTQLAAEIPPPPPVNQLEDQGVLAGDLARNIPTSYSINLSSSSTLAGRGGRGGRSSNARGIELAEIIPPPTPTTNQLEGQGVLAGR
jgi:hypothetical protein